jgi:hypothetical protein
LEIQSRRNENVFIDCLGSNGKNQASYSEMVPRESRRGIAIDAAARFERLTIGHVLSKFGPLACAAGFQPMLDRLFTYVSGKILRHLAKPSKRYAPFCSGRLMSFGRRCSPATSC